MIQGRLSYRSCIVAATLVLWCATCARPTLAVVKVIGDFEGDLLSPYTVDEEPLLWIADQGSTPEGMTVEYINVNDVDYVGGVTRGEQAVLLTHPNFWSGHYLRLNSDLPFLNDTANFPYLQFDVTTFGNPAMPDGGPADRQIFTIFNGPTTPDWPGWYDANFDSDMQQDPEVAAFDEAFHTTTLVVDMTAPEAINGDGMNFLNVASQAVLADHEDGTPVDPLYWQFLLLIQGQDQPVSARIQTVIDNIRLCSDLECSTSGDFNGDGVWDCADIDELTGAIAAMSTDLTYDMNGDGSVTLADITDPGTGWLAVGGANNPDDTGGNPFLPGDANLDGTVDGPDFLVWNNNKFTPLDAWCGGDFTADGTVDGADFLIWNNNKFSTSDSGMSAVPEPSSWALMAFSFLVLWRFQRV